MMKGLLRFLAVNSEQKDIATLALAKYTVFSALLNISYPIKLLLTHQSVYPPKVHVTINTFKNGKKRTIIGDFPF